MLALERSPIDNLDNLDNLDHLDNLYLLLDLRPCSPCHSFSGTYIKSKRCLRAAMGAKDSAPRRPAAQLT